MVSGSQLFFVVGGVLWYEVFFFFFRAEDGIRDRDVTGVQTCALPIWRCDRAAARHSSSLRVVYYDVFKRRLSQARPSVVVGHGESERVDSWRRVCVTAGHRATPGNLGDGPRHNRAVAPVPDG